MDELKRLEARKREDNGGSDVSVKNTVRTSAKTSSTNQVNTVSIPVSTASLHEGLSLADPTHPKEDDSEIPLLEDIYQNSTDCIFTTSSYDDEGAVADFTNLETEIQPQQFKQEANFEITESLGVLVDLLREVRLSYKVGLSEIRWRKEELLSEIKQVYKVVKALYGLHQAPRACSSLCGLISSLGLQRKSWCDEFEALMKSRFQMSSMGELTFFLRLQVKQKADGIFISQDKYVAEILKKFDFANVKTASTPIETQKPLVKGEEDCDGDCLSQSRFLLSDYARANLDRKSTTGGYQFHGRRLISWQCKKQTIVATSTTEAELCCCCAKLLWAKFYGFKINVRTMEGLRGFRESLRRVLDGTEALLLSTLFILWLDKVSTDSAKLVPLGKVCTAIETLKKNTAKVTPMAVLDSCPKHNMVAYLEKSEGNAEFHEIIDFLKSKIINNVRHITTKVAGKSVSISEASIRSDLLFDDTDGIDSLPNQAIFDAIQLMGSKSTYWDQIPTNIATAVICKQLANVSVPLDHFPVNTLTSKVFSFMVKKGKHFSGEVTPLFTTMLVQPTQDEGASSERPSEVQPTPSPASTSEVPHEPQTDSSPAHTSEVPPEQQTDPSPRPSPTTTIPNSIPETSGENLGGHSSSDKSFSGNEGDMTLQSVYDLCLFLCARVSDQAKEIQHLKAQITKLKKQAKPVIKYHRAWLKSVSLKQRFPRKSFSKKHRVRKESVSKQGRKFAKVDHMETENAQDEGRTRKIVDENKEIDENILSTEDVLSTDKEGVSTDRPIVSTDGSKKDSTDEQSKGTDDHTEEGSATQTTQPPTSTIFGNDETIAKVLLNMSQAKAVSREKEKGVEFKDIEETDRPMPTSTRSLLTLKPLPKIVIPKYKERRNREEDETESVSDDKGSDEDFISIGSAKDERLIKKMNEKGIDSSKNEMVKEEDKEEETPDEEKEVDYEILDRKYPIKEWKTEYLGTKPQVDKAKHLEEINQNVVIRSNGQKRYFSTLMRVLSIFDRDDLNAVYQLVMDRYQDEIPEGFDRVLWGDLMIMFNPDDEDKFWNSQQDWNIVSWKLHGSSGVHTLMTEAGLVIHMLVEKKYPLRKKVLLQMLELKLESEEDSTMALELIRFVKKLVAELEPEDSNGDEEDL
ncbi:putative ribonuclease H-like domain-containing protein [Tanacetum coccineum]